MAYTFKDSDADGTYFKDYNKVDGQQSVLVGNWYEERKLQEMTGHMRNSQWVAPSSISQQSDFEPMHTKMKGHPDLEDTTMRVFFHSNVRACVPAFCAASRSNSRATSVCTRARHPTCSTSPRRR